MEPSKEAIAVRITRLNRQILGKVTSGVNKFTKKTIDREALLDALTVLYNECNDDPVKKSDELVRAFVDKYRSTLAELRRTRVCLSDFKVLETIGRGHFAEVHMVREKQSGDVYALKSLRKEEARKRAVASTEDERDVLANANSPWIPRLQYAFQDNSNLYLVMELCSGGDLAGLLSRRNSPLSERDSAFYVAEVAQALKALHGMGYVHRDVKPHNILLDRCGHVKLGDLGSCGRLSEGSCGGTGAATPDYVAPELLAAADCASRHTVCLEYCRGIVAQAISACDYWSLGVVAFELVTLRRPFSVGDEDTLVDILSNIQKYESDPNSEPPFDSAPNGPSAEWRALVSGLLRVQPARRYNYLDTLQHAALAHLQAHSIRDQVPPWVPCVRGPEDASHFSPAPRVTPPASAALFRTRPPFAGQLPFLGYSYVAQEEGEDSTSGFNASHDCTAIDLATFKSAEKLAAMRSREITSLQNKLAAAEASVGVAVERTRRELESETERQRVRLQAEITALSLQNKRLERQVEVEKEERMALQRNNQELSVGIAERNNAEVRAARSEAGQLQAERDVLREDLRRLEDTVRDLQADCTRAVAAADAQRMQHQHYKESVAKERAIRRQTLSGSDSEREAGTGAGARLAQAEANAAREVRARELLEKRFATLQEEHASLQTEFDQIKRELTSTREALNEKQQSSDTSTNQLTDIQQQLAQEKLHSSTLSFQVQELERGLEESVRREATLEEQCARTEARLHERLQAAETRANNALLEDTRHREKVNSLEQLVRRLEREVTALEARGCVRCATRPEKVTLGAAGDAQSEPPQHEGRGEEAGALRVWMGSAARGDAHSDTESLADAAHAQLTLLKEQLERAEAQLQARAEEMATLRQETRAANLAKWRKEREYNELSVEAKSSARDLKRLEERLSAGVAARKAAELKATSLQSEITLLKPQYELARKDVDRLTEQLNKLQKTHETAQTEVDRSRNDIRKLKSELQYSEKRRVHAEEQEELSSRERAQLRDEMQEMRQRTNELAENNKALQEACSLLEEQLTDLEKLTDIQELKNKDLESELQRLRGEMEIWRTRAVDAEKLAAERAAAVKLSSEQYEEACERATQANAHLKLLKERLESRERQVMELETRAATLESELSGREAEAGGMARRLRDLHEECASLRTASHHHHATALRLQAGMADAQEELAAAREAAEAASAWWRTRETKAEATLRQQAKLIDFLQAKVEELGRKKCSLGNKLFGRSGRRPATSPPLRRANRELREEVERLRTKLAALKNENDYPPTPQRANPKKTCNGVRNIEMCEEAQDDSLQIVWSDSTRERMRVHHSDDVLVLNGSGTEVRAKLHSLDVKNLPQNEANRAFTIKFDYCGKSCEAAVVCSSIAERAQWVSKLQPSEVPSAGYMPVLLARHDSQPAAVLYIAPSVVAIGCSDGLHSLRGAVSIEYDSDVSPPRRTDRHGVTCVDAACGRALIVNNGSLVQGGLLAMGSALRRAGNLKPTVSVSRVKLPDGTPPHLIKTISGDTVGGPCVAVACGRRVFLLRFDASVSEFKISRSLTVDRPPTSLLLTARYLFITGEKPLKINLPSGALESFAMDEPTVAAAAKKQSPPKAILMVRENPLEIFLCYAECGVFVDENGKRTRNEDPKWSSAVHGWEFINPFLYILGEEKVTIIYLSEEAYKSPPCTCETTSLTSSSSDCYVPQIFNVKVHEPALLGTTPNGIIIRSKVDDGYIVFVIDGLAAFRSIGASVESLDTISDTKRSSTDLGPSLSDSSPHEISLESIEATTGFLADIRKRARQLRSKNRTDQTEPTPDDVIKRILTTEVGLKRTSNGRKSPATISEFDSDSTESEERTGSTKCTADLCAEMFTKQVQFQ